MKRLTDKNICITGCNRGIGRAAVTRFAEEGANLYCAMRKENEEFCKSLYSHAPKGKPEEVANLMVFLASDESSYVNGQTIRIDGGM